METETMGGRGTKSKTSSTAGTGNKPNTAGTGAKQVAAAANDAEQALLQGHREVENANYALNNAVNEVAGKDAAENLMNDSQYLKLAQGSHGRNRLRLLNGAAAAVNTARQGLAKLENASTVASKLPSTHPVRSKVADRLASAKGRVESLTKLHKDIAVLVYGKGK